MKPRQKRQQRSQSDTAREDALQGDTPPGSPISDTDQFRMVVMELLTNEDVLKKMKNILFLQSLSDGVDYLKKKIDNLTAFIEEKDARISELERLVSTTETKLDALDQYSRRANLRFQGLNENQDGEDIETQIINIINNEIGLTPPLQTSEIVRCHRVGRMPNEPGRPRPVLVKFQCERRRDTILRQRGKLILLPRVPCWHIRQDN